MKKQKLVKQVSYLEAERDALRAKNLSLNNALNALRRDMKILEKISLTDGLTGIGNRRAFSTAIRYATENYKHTGDKFALVVVDINDLKPINDELGHEAGDTLIKSAASILTNAARTTDGVFRLGGDEFSVILNNTSNGLPFKNRIKELCTASGISMASGWSTISHLPYKLLSAEEIAEYLFKLADREMYSEKSMLKASRIIGR